MDGEPPRGHRGCTSRIKELTPRKDSSRLRFGERALSLHVELLRVEVVSDQARDERALLVTELHTVALEAIQLFLGKEHADF